MAGAVRNLAVRIVAERLHGHWSAWFADAPGQAYGGQWPSAAIERLLKSHPERGVIPDQIVALDEAAQV